MGKENEKQNLGIDNKAFEVDEPQVRVIPPTVNNTLQSRDESFGVKPLTTKETGTVEPSKEKADETPSKEQAIPPPKTPARTPTPIKSPKRPKPSSKPGSFRAEKTDIKASTSQEEDVSFDPEGKSAVSGQKRTGWI